MKKVLSLSVIVTYILIWTFVGVIFVGVQGLEMFSITATFLILLTFLFGDKFILLVLGARDITIKNTDVSSFLSHLCSQNEVVPMRTFRLRSGDYGICLVNSIFSGKSLVLSERLLRELEGDKRQRTAVENLEYKREKIVDLAINLCYQMLMPGYLLGLLSPLLKSIYFFLAYPIIMAKNKLSRARQSQNIQHVRIKRKKNKKNTLIMDVIRDYGILLEERDNLWSCLSSSR